MEPIRLNHITKSFGSKVVLQNFSAVIPSGRTSCLMAPSGAGKTTLLRILMGLEQPDAGEITGLNGLKISAVFQEDRLCEDLSPVANIRLVSPRRTFQEVCEAMRAVDLKGCENQPCRELSGGMRRRVALLRALMADYDLLFLDEPFQGLDAQTKSLVIRDTRERCSGQTVLMVTHNADECTAMGAVQVLTLA